MAKTQKAKSRTSKPAASAKTTSSVSEPTKVTRVSIPKVSLNSRLPLGKLLVELVGTFVLTSVVLASLNGKFGPLTVYVDKAILEAQGQTAPVLAGTGIMAAFTVTVMALIALRVSGAHFNPAITAGLWAARKIKAASAGLYILAQLLGAMLAVVVVTKFVDATVVAQLNPAGGWKQFFAEALGALIFGFGFASVVFAKKEGLEAAATIGGAFLLGIVVASLGSNAVINPALALGVGSLKWDLWSIVSYVVAPLVGAIAGMGFYKLVQNDAARAETEV